MKLSEFISSLNSLLATEGDHQVVTDGYENGFDDPDIRLSYRTPAEGENLPWNGKYSETPNGMKTEGCERVIVIARKGTT